MNCEEWLSIKVKKDEDQKQNFMEETRKRLWLMSWKLHLSLEQKRTEDRDKILRLAASVCVRAQYTSWYEIRS